MRHLLTSVLIATLSLTATTTFASPKQLITHNQTDLDSNAYIAGTTTSHHTTKAGTDGRIFWGEVRIACLGKAPNNKCSALVRLGANTANPIDLGMVEMDINTGIITPGALHANGYTLLVKGPGETTLLKD